LRNRQNKGISVKTGVVRMKSRAFAVLPEAHMKILEIVSAVFKNLEGNKQYVCKEANSCYNSVWRFH
jgi:hypothetical protein